MEIRRSTAASILSPVSGFIQSAGFTHSLTPARNCTYGCTYCYVPTMHVFGGLQREDWMRWGQFTTFKRNAADLLRNSVRGNEIIYCSPLVDPYQPAEVEEALMPEVLRALIDVPPKVFVLQTRGPAVLRDLPLLRRLADRCRMRVSFSLTTDDERIRRLYEPHCASHDERLNALRELTRAGIQAFATLAPLLPCGPERLTLDALETTKENLIGDPLHVRQTKRTGATTRDAARRIAAVHDHQQWFDPAYQSKILERIRCIAERYGRTFITGPEGFSCLAQI